jgi:hypothetical protein
MRCLLTAICCTALSAFAADSKEDAQKKVDEAMQQSCELAKKNVADKAAECPDESKALAAVNCADKGSRKSVDFLKLNVECAKKLKADAKAAKAEAKEAKAEAKDEKAADKKGGSHCKVMDEAGAVVLEHDSEGGSIKCQGEIREKVKASKCTPKAKLTLQYVGESAPGKEGKPIAMNITCPAK